MGARIVILSHAADRFDAYAYLMESMCGIWKREGHEVKVHSSPVNPPPGDVAVVHVDLTKVPPAYLKAARAYPRVINGGARDISKRTVSRNLVRRGDGYAGPVMVKANLNHGGVPEARMALQGAFLRRWAQRRRQKLPWFLRAEVPVYRIFNTPRDVPAPVWWNPDLVVERFLSEREGEFYCLRTWMFLGEVETNSVSFSREPQVKSTNVVGRRIVDEIPDDLRAWRRELGFDFGKFDYAIVEGKTVLYDANRTPTAGGINPKMIQERVATLATGLTYFL